MKIFLCLLLIKVCSCVDDSEQSNNYCREIVYNDEKYGQQHGPIERPCSLHNVNCIRRYFAHNSRCSPTHGPAQDPYWIKSIPLNVPHVNITFTLNDIEIKGFNDWKIKEFYINKETNRLVLEVEFSKLEVYSAKTVIAYYRKGKEPLEIVDYAFIEYRDLSLTLTVPQIKDLDLSRAHVYTYISDAAPKNGLGPNFTGSKDPFVLAVNRRLLENLGLSLQEAFVMQGPLFMSVFLQSSICNYKI